jgi:hypothetical protein
MLIQLSLKPSTLTELVPTVPPLPDRVPELKASFFIRGRSGSISAASQRTQLTHTFQQQFTAPAPVQLQTSATHRPRSTVKELKNITPSRNSISGPLEPSSTVGSRSSDPWVRVGGVGSERSLSNSPTSVRRRVASVPTRPPRLIEPHPPMPNEQHISRVQGSEADCSTMPSQELSSVRRPGTSAECSARPGRNGHGVKSASVSIPVSYGARTSAGARPSEQERSSLKHLKQSSMSASEGLVLKSALKYRSAEQPIQTHQKPLAGRVEPMNTSRRSAGLELDSSRLPTPPSEDRLNGSEWASTDPPGAGNVTSHKQANKSAAKSSSPGPGSSDDSTGVSIGTLGGVRATPERAVVVSGTTGSFGSPAKGHGLATSDSRSLPVLDNIWGSFISETAFGSLPPSPMASIRAKYRAPKSQETGTLEQPSPSLASSHSSPNSSYSPPGQNQWRPGSAPPTAPPVTSLPPVPSRPSPVAALSLSSIPLRKRSRSPADTSTFSIPPIAPTEEADLQGLDLMVTSSASDSGLLDVSASDRGKQSTLTGQQTGPRLTRSTSSPTIRPSPTPNTELIPVGVRGYDSKARLSVKVQGSRSPSLSSVSQSSSQCTSVPGTPVYVPLLTTHAPLSYLGASSGQLMLPSLSLNRDRTQTQKGQAPDSEIIQDGVEEDQSEDPLLTPPITPAWVAQVFDTEEDSVNESDCDDIR